MNSVALSKVKSEDANEVLDALIVGAGFSGLRALMHTRDIGLKARVIEAGSDVGGTWYWNTYPGARTDSESWYYCFSFSDEMLNEWDWKERYSAQPEMFEYISHVVDRFDLRRDIIFNTKMTRARFLADVNLWEIETNAGETFRARFLIAGMGILSTPYLPDFKGVESFKGELYVTGRWPKEKPDFQGKRVGVIGTGATGVQAIPIIAETAGHLIVFQRTAQFIVPAHNYYMTDEQRVEIKSNYDAIWTKARNHGFAMPVEQTERLGAETPADERHAVFEEGWKRGGFRYMFETFADILIDSETNEAAADFIRAKIRETVKDPVTAELLCPKGYPYGSKRPPAGHFYYEAFNRENVSLVDVSRNTIQRITETGVETAEGHFELDMLVFATGFDVFTGAFTAIDIIGENGQTLGHKFAEGPKSYLGLAISGFPNLLIINGPLCPFANMPVTIEKTSEWVHECLKFMSDNHLNRVEVTADAEKAWVDEVNTVGMATLVPGGAAANSWLTGSNIPGKAEVMSVYLGGYVEFAKKVDQEKASGFPNFMFA